MKTYILRDPKTVEPQNAQTITAMAQKLARILWHLPKFKHPFNPEVFAQAEEKMKRKKLARLQILATTLNYRLVPNQ